MVPILFSPNGPTFTKGEHVVHGEWKRELIEIHEEERDREEADQGEVWSFRLQPSLGQRIWGQASRGSRGPESPIFDTCKFCPICSSLVHRLCWLAVSSWIFVSSLELFSSWEAYMACSLSLCRFNCFLRSLERGQVWVGWKDKKPADNVEVSRLSRCVHRRPTVIKHWPILLL